MKTFTLDKGMVNFRGHFYPTGHIVASFPSEQAAREAVRALTQAGVDENEITWMSPDAVLTALSETITDSETPLPSPGTESDTSRQFVEFASRGHFTIMVPTPHGDSEDRVMEALLGAKPAHAQKYRKLVIEDIA